MRQLGEVLSHLAPDRPKRERILDWLRRGRDDPDANVRKAADRALWDPDDPPCKPVRPAP
jgi:hypothetical protein